MYHHLYTPFSMVVLICVVFVVAILPIAICSNRRSWRDVKMGCYIESQATRYITGPSVCQDQCPAPGKLVRVHGTHIKGMCKYLKVPIPLPGRTLEILWHRENSTWGSFGTLMYAVLFYLRGYYK